VWGFKRMEKKKKFGCGKLIGYAGNINIYCGENTCNGNPVTNFPIHLCKKCKKKATAFLPALK